MRSMATCSVRYSKSKIRGKNILGRWLKIETASQTYKLIHNKQRLSTSGIGQPVPGKGRPSASWAALPDNPERAGQWHRGESCLTTTGRVAHDAIWNQIHASDVISNIKKKLICFRLHWWNNAPTTNTRHLAIYVCYCKWQNVCKKCIFFILTWAAQFVNTTTPDRVSGVCMAPGYV